MKKIGLREIIVRKNALIKILRKNNEELENKIKLYSCQNRCSLRDKRIMVEVRAIRKQDGQLRVMHFDEIFGCNKKKLQEAFTRSIYTSI